MSKERAPPNAVTVDRFWETDSGVLSENSIGLNLGDMSLEDKGPKPAELKRLGNETSATTGLTGLHRQFPDPAGEIRCSVSEKFPVWRFRKLRGKYLIYGSETWRDPIWFGRIPRSDEIRERFSIKFLAHLIPPPEAGMPADIRAQRKHVRLSGHAQRRHLGLWIAPTPSRLSLTWGSASKVSFDAEILQQPFAIPPRRETPRSVNSRNGTRPSPRYLRPEP